MPRFTREEIELAWEKYQDAGLASARSGDWTHWGKVFTEDCDYHECTLGKWGGRDSIVREMAAFMHTNGSSEFLEGPGLELIDQATTPVTLINQYPKNDYVIDMDRGWVWTMIWQRLEDPGDGSVHESNCLTLLHYDGDGLFSHEYDLYNPNDFFKMMDSWNAAVAKCKEEESKLSAIDAKVDEVRALALDTQTPSPETRSLVRPKREPFEFVPEPQGRFLHDEIEAAFKEFRNAMSLSGKTNDWRHMGMRLTTDATVIESELGRLGQRNSIVREIHRALYAEGKDSVWANLNHFPVAEYTIDAQRDAVWALFDARFRDPGDGSKHQAQMFVRLVYDGEGLFREIETMYSPYLFEEAKNTWLEASARCTAKAAERAKGLSEMSKAAVELLPLRLNEDGEQV